MQEETAQELRSHQRHVALLAAVSIVLPTKGDTLEAATITSTTMGATNGRRSMRTPRRARTRRASRRASTWTKEVASYSAPDEVAATDAALQNAISTDWFVFEKSIPFDFEIFCDTAAELSDHTKARKLHGEEIPYDELEERRAELGAQKTGAPIAMPQAVDAEHLSQSVGPSANPITHELPAGT
jgi:hypothetical protein